MELPGKSAGPTRVILVPRDLLGSSFELPRGFALRALIQPEVYLCPRAILF